MNLGPRLAPSVPPGIRGLELTKHRQCQDFRILRKWFSAHCSVFWQGHLSGLSQLLKDEIKIASNYYLISLKVLQVVKKTFKESWIAFVCGINVCQGYVFSICF